MALNLKQLIKRAKEYIEVEAHAKVKHISFVERFLHMAVMALLINK